DRPPLSKGVLAGTVEPAGTELVTAQELTALDVTARPGTRAIGLDLSTRTVMLADGARVPFDRLVIATGSAPRLLPGLPTPERPPGTDAPPDPRSLRAVHALRTLEDAAAIAAGIKAGARIVVAGGGFIGAEVAAAARSAGC